MSFVTQFFIKPVKPRLLRLPTGSFTIGPDGEVMGSTVSQTVPANELRLIGKLVLATFRASETAGTSLTEICFQFRKMKLVAREIRKGAIIFFEPE
jgi:hypothetical protein